MAGNESVEFTKRRGCCVAGKGDTLKDRIGEIMVGIKEETKSLPFYGEIERELPRGAKGAPGV